MPSCQGRCGLPLMKPGPSRIWQVAMAKPRPSNPTWTSMFGQRLLGTMFLEPQAAREWGQATNFLSFVWGDGIRIWSVSPNASYFRESHAALVRTNEILDGNMIDIYIIISNHISRIFSTCHDISSDFCLSPVRWHVR